MRAAPQRINTPANGNDDLTTDCDALDTSVDTGGDVTFRG